jgi:small subunit ribosomal protein S17
MQFVLKTKYQLHDETNDCNIGDTVGLAETRPLKTKCWRWLKS